MISFPAPAEPPMIATIKLGTIAKHRVKKLRIHGLSRKSRKPFNARYLESKMLARERGNFENFSSFVHHQNMQIYITEYFNRKYLHNILPRICSCDRRTLT
ncbi:hypothetical protein PanWU01x14_175370 [Parasponia andersonii]|uniref:Uncharacterized protein n=1 Tax=Parasponia andersonii TaxID=3476 RepID=A0A2P5C8C0_PARAD|nr:hypothetical protein PanWU01x14_175370 [Parasponia andersonii]